MNEIHLFLKRILLPLKNLRLFVVITFIASDIAGLAQPFVLGKIIDAITVGDKSVVKLFVLDFILLVTSFVLNFVQNYYWFKMIHEGSNLTRKALIRETLHQNHNFFRTYNRGDILNRLLNDSSRVSESHLITMPMYILNISTLIIVFAFLYMQNVVLAFIVTVFSIVYFLYYSTLNRKLRKYSEKERESYSRLMDVTDEALSGYDAILKNQGEDFFKERLSKETESNYQSIMTVQKWKSLGTTATQFLLDSIPLIIMVAGAFMVFNGQATIGVLFSFYTYIPSLNQPITNLTDANMTIQSGKAVEERVSKLLSKNDESDGHAITDIRSLSFDDVSFAWDEKAIIQHLSFTVKKGDRIFVEGPSGIGKSTLMKLIMKEIIPQEGSINVNSTNINEISTRDYYKYISTVPQDFFIFHGTKMDNITFQHSYSLDNNILDVDFINEIPDDNVTNCSGGEKQRILFARAMIRDADLLILDEPTSALDEKTKMKLMKYLNNPQYRDKIMFIISHEQLLKSLCNHCITFEENKVNFV